MKQVKFKFPVRMMAVVLGLFLSVGAFAQQIAVNGHVKDATGEPIIGATVLVVGGSTTQGAVTDLDGNFTLDAPQGATLRVSYIGYTTQEVSAAANVVVTLQDDAEQSLNEVVVIGYGAVKKSDLTGSVTALKPDSKNKGLVVNAQDMLAGKVAGVSVTDGGGTPGGGSTIRIRGGSSLTASNDPLIVIDGVPMDNNGVKGLANGLSMINPQDIESFNVLKDASATAIYGSRGSNGVIIITTKKGHKGQKPSVSYSGSVTMSKKKKTIDMLDGDEYREFVRNLFAGDAREADALAALGDANTNWQDEIYRTAWSQDHGITVAGSFGSYLPYRLSLGYTNQQGIVKTSDFKRYTAALNLNPSFLDDHLTLNLNAKGMWAKSRYADGDAISAAVRMDPTHSVRDYTSADAANFDNYFEWRQATGATFNDDTWPYIKTPEAMNNPVADLALKNDRAISRSFIGNADIDYKVHGFEDLRLHATLGADISKGHQNTDVDPRSPLANYYGSHGWDEILKRNLTLSAYAQYYHDFNDKAQNHFDIMAGYEWSHVWRDEQSKYFSYYGPNHKLYPNGVNYESGTDYDGDGKLDPYHFRSESYIVSFFGRANWSLMDRYMLTATVRYDGSSRFNWISPYDNEQWGLFPSAAFAWKIKDENAFKDVEWLSDLKLRLGWGMTGQQEVNQGDYPYYAIYALNNGKGSFYDIAGDGTMAMPNAYNPALKWETTTTYNIGFDWGLFNQRLTGSVDWYHRVTKDLLNSANVAAGTNFANQVIQNIGSLKNSGIEVALGWKVIRTKDWFWTIDYNFTYNHNEITKLTGGDDSDYFVPTGGISSGTGNTCQAHAVGHPASSFYVYQQVYDENGKPLEGVVVDRNGNGTIDEGDKYFYKSPAAPYTMGLSSRLEWKNFDFGFSLRASIGNYVFNDAMDGKANLSTAAIYKNYGQGYLENIPRYSLDANWQTYEVTSTLSDRWVQNASFLKCDNITLGYSFNNLFKVGNYKGVSGRVYGTVNNVFTITKYDGIDPEVFGGIDNNIYPRPISFILGLNLNF